MFEPRIHTRTLADLCRRVSTSLKAGVDARKNWQREALNARGFSRRPMETIRDGTNRGQSLSEVLPQTGRYFPPLFHEMVLVGEQTGHLAEVLHRLSEHYQHQLELKKSFRQAISKPAIQLVFAICVVGLLIFFMGIIADRNGGKPIDFLGLGLMGADGLKKYMIFLAVVATLGWVMYREVKSGRWWGEWLQRSMMHVPKIGHALELLALSRFAWSLHLTLDTGMGLRQAMRMAFAATHNGYYTPKTDFVLQHIREGHELTETLRETRVFPADFLDAFQVGEQTGKLVETLGVLSEHYQEEGREAIRTLTRAAGGLVWLAVTGIIVMLIFRIASFYIGIINDAANGKF
jgi:type II secretory pathway component PulF